MNEDTIKGNWKQFRGEMKKAWADITDDEFTRVEGERDKLEGLIQERYGRSREQAREEVDRFFKDRKGA